MWGMVGRAPFVASPFTASQLPSRVWAASARRSVGLVQEYRAVGIGDAAIDRVAAHDGNDVGILPRLVFPDHLAGLVQIQRVDGVRERRDDVHDVADHQRPAFMAAPHAGREAPYRLELAAIALVDLVEDRKRTRITSRTQCDSRM